MYNRLLGHLNNNSILFEEKFGFRQNLTTKKATYELMKFHVLNDILWEGFFCFLAIAFDCVSHDTLLYKLNFSGITGKVYAWIISYFTDRYQRPEIKIKIPIMHIQTGEL